MKHIKYLFFLSLAISLASCEYFESPDDTVNVSQGTIIYPAIALEGERFVTIPLGGTFEDAGAVASLGTEDITKDIVISGSVDPNTAGVYTIDYTVSVVNALDETSSASQQRYVAVITESVSSMDLSGQYNGDGTAFAGSWTQSATVTPITGAWYRIDKALASGNNLGLFFALVGGGGEGGVDEKIIVPDQASVFGNVNSTDPGTSAMLIENGFQWEIFIGCCGVFGPIIFTR